MAAPESRKPATAHGKGSKHTSNNSIKKPRPHVRYIGPAKAARIADAVSRGKSISGESAVSSTETPNTGLDADHRELQMQERIRAAIRHRECHNATSKQQVAYNYVTVAVTDPPSCSSELLQDFGIPTLIKEDRGSETYALPIPITQAFGALPYPWWAGLSPAQVRAGPLADEADVKKAAGDLNAKAKRRQKSLQARNGLLRTQAEYMLESLRRQILRLPMEGAVTRGQEREAMAKYGREWEIVLQEVDEERESTHDSENTYASEDDAGMSSSDDGDEYRGESKKFHM